MEDFMDNDDARPSTIDDLLDEVLPEELEWDRLVRTYPLSAVAVAAAGGFVLALSHGPAILSAVSGYLSAQVSRNVSQILGQEIGQ